MPRVKATRRVSVELTSSQREWLSHIQRCETSGLSKTAYAKQHGLSIQAMYHAANRLRRLGALPPAGRALKAASFVRVSSPPQSSGTWRVRFANGAILEGNQSLTNELLSSMVEALSIPQ